MPPASTRSGFTLLEVCLAVFIALLLVVVAVPTLSGVITSNRAADSFASFDAVVQQARLLAIEERRAYRIVWEEGGISLEPEEAQEDPADLPARPFAKGEEIGITFPAALVKETEPVWTFWPSGVCEPAQITRTGPDGGWSATYHPLTGEATVAYGE